MTLDRRPKLDSKQSSIKVVRRMNDGATFKVVADARVVWWANHLLASSSSMESSVLSVRPVWRAAACGLAGLRESANFCSTAALGIAIGPCAMARGGHSVLSSRPWRLSVLLSWGPFYSGIRGRARRPTHFGGVGCRHSGSRAGALMSRGRDPSASAQFRCANLSDGYGNAGRQLRPATLSAVEPGLQPGGVRS